MVPDNPSNSNPFIFRILDSLGIPHQTAPVNHTHAQSEVSGLVSALAGKANANHTHDINDVQNLGSILSSLESSIASKIPKVSSPTAGNFPKFKGDGTLQDSGFSSSSFADAATTAAALAGKQDTLIFDTTPTASSTNPVTSGGVKAALDGKPSVYDTEVVFLTEENPYIYLPNYFTHGENQKTFIINYQGSEISLEDIFGVPSSSDIRFFSHDDSTITIQECYIALRVIRQPNGTSQGVDAYYIIFDGRDDY